MKILSPEAQGSLYAIISGLLYGLVGYFGMSLLKTDLFIANMQFWRFLVSGLFMGMILLKDFKTLSDNGKTMLKAFLSGALFYSTSTGIYFLASKYIGSGLSMVLLFTFPAIVMLLNRIVYKIQIPKIYYFAILLIIVGMTQLIDIGEVEIDLIGIGLAVLSGVLYAFYVMAGKQIQISALMSTVMASLGCASAFLIFSLWEGSFALPPQPLQWAYIIGFGVFSTALPMLFLLKGLRKISAEKASILSVLEPVFVVIFGVLLLGEVLNLPKIIGIITILSGALITLFSSHPLFQKVPFINGKEHNPVHKDANNSATE